MSARMEFTRRLLETLWENYAERVPYARMYQEMLTELGGMFVNDHIAFRCLDLSVSGQELGLSATCNIFAALGYQEKGELDFPAQKLSARYLQHDEPDFPKVFVSHLRVGELDPPTQQLIRDAVKDTTLPLKTTDLQALRNLDTRGEPEGLFDRVVRHFSTRPWPPPIEEAVHKVHAVTQYGAWVLLHGFAVNHFTGYVNRHGVDSLDDIEKVVFELKKRGVPLKEEIEGARGSKLRQISTLPSKVSVKVCGANGAEKEIEWTYAYMEFVQRGEVEENGARRLFQGFLGPHASQFFEMTRML